MALNTLEQKESVDQKKAFSQEFAKDLELYENFQKAKKQSETVPVVREIAKNNADAQLQSNLKENKKNILNILHAKKSPEVQKKSEIPEINKIDFNKLPQIPETNKLPDLDRTLFTNPEKINTLRINNWPILANYTKSNPASIAAGLLDHNPKLVEELAKYKQDIVEWFPDVFDKTADNLSRDIALA